MDAHTIPVPAVLPLAEMVNTPPEFPGGALIVLCEIGIVLNVVKLNW
jgi:hypothetical protein